MMGSTETGSELVPDHVERPKNCAHLCDGIGQSRWSQSGDAMDIDVCICIPLPLPSAQPEDLAVEVRDAVMLCVRHKEDAIVRWRLHAPVSDDVAWRVEGDNTVIIQLRKQTPTIWRCLVELPMPDDDYLLVQPADICSMLADHLPSLASPEEVLGSRELSADEASEQQVRAAQVKAELENYSTELMQMSAKMAEVEARLSEEEEGTNVSVSATKEKTLLEEMLRLHKRCHSLRCEPSSLVSFLEYTKTDLQKARVNAGEMGHEEVEEYDSDAERSLTATELMSRGLECFECRDINGCLHFLRLAAVHHHHDQSILLLYDIYTRLGSSRGAFLLFHRALDDANPSASANQKMGELYDEGAPHFPPLFPAAVYFYQRAAQLGSVGAMLSLAQLWLRGSTTVTHLSQPQVEAHRSVAKHHAWVQKAIDRGCGSAMFVKGCMHLKGEHGTARSLALAKELLGAASNCQPELQQHAPQILLMVDAFRAEEELYDDSCETHASASI